MNVEDKKRVLAEYCKSTDCSKCVLKVDGWGNELSGVGCLIIGLSPERDLDRALDLISYECTPDVSTPDYWARVCEKQRQQTEKGLSKYGMTLEDNTELTIGERLNHLEEELIDALMYIEHLKEKLEV